MFRLPLLPPHPVAPAKVPENRLEPIQSESNDEEEAEVSLALQRRMVKSTPAERIVPEKTVAKGKKSPNAPALQDAEEEEEDETPLPLPNKKGRKPTTKKTLAASKKLARGAKKITEAAAFVPRLLLRAGTGMDSGSGSGSSISSSVSSSSMTAAAASVIFFEPEPEPEPIPVPALKSKRGTKAAPPPANRRGSKKTAPEPEPVIEFEEEEEVIDNEPTLPPPLPNGKSRAAAPLKKPAAKLKFVAPKKPAAAKNSKGVRKTTAAAEESDHEEPSGAAPDDEGPEEQPAPAAGRKKPVRKPVASKRMPPATANSGRNSVEPRPSQRITHEKPPEPTRESADIDGSRRSARHRIQPLAFWKGEKVQYALDTTATDRAMRMPEMVEIVRVKEEEVAAPSKARKRKAGVADIRAPTKRARAADDAYSDPGEPELWEVNGYNGEEAGVRKGVVRAFPIQTGEDDDDFYEMEVQLAYAKGRIQTVDTAGGEFKFIKTFSHNSFGTGLIEIPPGGGKRTKNSDKMMLVFYVIRGRVTVTIAENRFRVGKDGQFMVPRGRQILLRERETDIVC